MKEIQKSANKFAVLADEDDTEKYAEKVDHDSKLVVDCFILNTKKPSAEEFRKWSQEMVQYFKYRWQIVNKGIGLSDDEEDILDNNKDENECLNLQEQRPSMTMVVKELESALKLQVSFYFYYIF